MGKDLRQTLIDNLNFFMAREGAPYKNANSLGLAAGVAANTVRNLLNPRQRPVTSAKPEGYPTLDTIQVIATALGCEVWELLHPDIARSIREREMYRNIERDMEERLNAEKRQGVIVK